MRKPRILLVEDNRDTLDLEEVLFRGIGGYDVERASSVAGALAAFACAAPNLVLLDVAMPGMDGWHFFASPLVAHSRVPIVVTTGLARSSPPPEVRRRLAGYLVKPFAVSKLLSGCAHVLHTATAYAAKQRREHERRTFLIDAKIHWAGSTLAAQLHDIAEGGFRIHCDVPLPPDEIVSSELHVPWHRTHVEMKGRVCWRNLHLHGIQSLQPISCEPLMFGSGAGNA
jgi:CheY-like chemotaxis protein